MSFTLPVKNVNVTSKKQNLLWTHRTHLNVFQQNNTYLVLLLLRFVQATEAQQPGAVARGNCGGEGQSLHRHRVHGEGRSHKFTIVFFF